MARVTFKMPDDMIRKMSQLGENTDMVCEEVLKSGADVMERRIRSNLTGVIGTNTKNPSQSTGELASSLGITPVKLDKKGNYNIKIGFKEPRRSGKANAMVANILEYGKSDQQARPFLKPAITAGKKDCINTMQETFDKVVNNL